MKKPSVLIFGLALVLLIVVVGCTRTDYGAFHDPVMSTDDIQAELERLHQINLTVGTDEFDPSDYPIVVGVDPRNGKMLTEKFICWDECPAVGMVFLMYQGVATEEACAQSVVGTPLWSPEPIPGQYWGCRPIVNWLDRRGTVPD